MAHQKGLEVKVPWTTLFVACVSLAAFFWPHGSELLMYDRQAVLKGELWRLTTAPFVHFSGSHLFWNLVVFTAAGVSIETANHKGFLVMCVFTAIFPSIIYLLISPELARYGGLSGLATGAMTYLCLCQLRSDSQNSAIWIAVIALIGIKIIFEMTSGTTLFVPAGSEPFHVLPSVHMMGCAGAVFATAWCHRIAASTATAQGRNRFAFRGEYKSLSR
jgi:rhomboid family GlyGly-CTERM serine protease